MKSLFSLYPGHVPGIALLVLRASAALLMVAVLLECPSRQLWLSGALEITALAIAIGFATRLFATLCATLGTALLLGLGGAPMLLIVTHTLDLTALLLLGPGAFSVDARLFGRRTIALSGRRSKE